MSPFFLAWVATGAAAGCCVIRHAEQRDRHSPAQKVGHLVSFRKIPESGIEGTCGSAIQLHRQHRALSVLI